MASAGLDADRRRVLEPTGRPRFARVVVGAAAVRRVFDPTGRPRFAPVEVPVWRAAGVALDVVLRAVDLRVVRLRAVLFGAGALGVSAIE
jgi:hypothetical protein